MPENRVSRVVEFSKNLAPAFEAPAETKVPTCGVLKIVTGGAATVGVPGGGGMKFVPPPPPPPQADSPTTPAHVSADLRKCPSLMTLPPTLDWSVRRIAALDVR